MRAYVFLAVLTLLFSISDPSNSLGANLGVAFTF